MLKQNSKIIVANWKMNGNSAFMEDYIQSFNELSKNNSLKNEVVICPPHLYLDRLRNLLSSMDSHVKIGAQDCSEHNCGAYTGDNSASMLQDLGVQYVIIGHSERRRHYYETNKTLTSKIYNVVSNGLVPILCIGETLQHKEDGHTQQVLAEQLSILRDCKLDDIIIAYEPVWAIGTGKVAEVQDIVPICKYIYGLLEKYGYKGTKVLYGGSVNEHNSARILALDKVDGLLVGGASLQASSFCSIIGGVAI